MKFKSLSIFRKNRTGMLIYITSIFFVPVCIYLDTFITENILYKGNILYSSIWEVEILKYFVYIFSFGLLWLFPSLSSGTFINLSKSYLHNIRGRCLFVLFIGLAISLFCLSIYFIILFLFFKTFPHIGYLELVFHIELCFSIWIYGLVNIYQNK